MANQPDAEPSAGHDPAPETGPPEPARSRPRRVSRRTVLRLASVGVLGGISLVSLYVGQRGPEGGSGRPVGGPFPTPTAVPTRAARPAATTPVKAAGPTTIGF